MRASARSVASRLESAGERALASRRSSPAHWHGLRKDHNARSFAASSAMVPCNAGNSDGFEVRCYSDWSRNRWTCARCIVFPNAPARATAPPVTKRRHVGMERRARPCLQVQRLLRRHIAPHPSPALAGTPALLFGPLVTFEPASRYQNLKFRWRFHSSAIGPDESVPAYAIEDWVSLASKPV